MSLSKILRRGLPAIPETPKNLDPQLRPLIAAMKEALEVRLGRRGDPLEEMITRKDLVDIGVAQIISGRRGEIAALPAPVNPDARIIPPEPAGFTALPAFGGVVLTWDSAFEAYKVHAYTEVWRSLEPDPSTRELIDSSRGTVLFDRIADPEEVTYYYWVRHVSEYNRYGPFSEVQSAAKQADIDAIMERIAGEIGDSALDQSLRERIELIDAPASLGGSVSERIAAARAELQAQTEIVVSDLEALDERVVDLEVDAAALRNKADGLGGRVDQLDGRVDNAYDRADDAVAAITSLQARADTFALGITTLDETATVHSEELGRLDVAIAEGEAEVARLFLAQAERDQLTAIELMSAEVAYQGNRAGIFTEAMVRAGEDGALAQRITSLSVDMTTQESNLKALIASEEQARVAQGEATVSAREQLAAQIRGSYTGSDLTQLTSGLLHQERQARVMENQSLVQQISLISAGVGEQFDPLAIYHFDDSSDAWTGAAAPLVADGWMTPANGNDPYVRSPAGLDVDASKYNQVRLRVRKEGAPTWAGSLRWKLAGSSTWLDLALNEPDYDLNGIGMIIADPRWSGTIDQIEVKLSAAQSATDGFSFDWVAVGRPSPGASSAALAEERQARAQADSVEAQARETLSAALVGDADPNTATLPALTSGLIFEERRARSTADGALASSISQLDAKFTGKDTDVRGLIVTEQTTRAAEDGALASAISQLDTRFTNSDTSVRGLIASEATARSAADGALSSALNAMDTKFSTRDTEVRGLIVTEKNASVSRDEALASDINALDTKFTGKDTDVRGLIATEASTRATEDGALANSISLLDTKFTGMDTDVRGLIATEATTRATEDGALASSISQLDTKFTGMDTDVRGLITNAQNASASRDEALAGDITALDTKFAGKDTEVRGLIATEATTRAAEDGALATSISALDTKFTNKDTDVRGLIATEASTRAAEDGALASSIGVLDTKFTGKDADVRGLIATEATARATADGALTNEIAQANSRINGAEAQIDTERMTRADADKALALEQARMAANLGENEASIDRLARVQAEADMLGAVEFTALEAAAFGNTAGVLNEQRLRITEDEALATNISALAARVGESEAELIAERTTRASEDQALAQEIIALQAAVGEGVDATIQLERAARVEGDEALAAQINTLYSQSGANASAIQNEATARANADSALAQQVNTLQATIGDEFAAVSQKAVVGGEGGNRFTTRWWKKGQRAPAMAFTENGTSFALNGGFTEQAAFEMVGPNGVSQTVWQCIADGDGNADGGWNADFSGIDDSRPIISSVWVWSNGSGRFYLGAGQAGNTLNLDGTVDNNPYYCSGLMIPAQRKWYLAVGVLHPAGYSGGQTGMSGLWDPATGTRVLAGHDYKMAPGTTVQRHRTYQYYSPAGSEMCFADPRFELMTAATTPHSLMAGIITRGLTAEYSVKLDVNGYVSGWASYNTGNVATTAFLADRFYIARPGVDGSAVQPFIVENGNVYINTAFIKSASIQQGMIGPISFGKIVDGNGNPVTTVAGLLRANAIDVASLQVTNGNIAGVIQSNAVGANGQPRWRLDKNGGLTLNGPGGARVELNERVLKVYDSSWRLRVQIGDLYA